MDMKALEITSYIGCPNLCHYCPQDLLVSNYNGKSKMDMNDFKTILSNTPKDVRIDFTGFSEIFIHPQGSEFIRLTVLSGYEIFLYTTLVGFNELDAKILRGLEFPAIFHQYDGVNLDEFNFKKNIFLNEIDVIHGSTVKISNENGGVPIISRAGTVFETPQKYGAFHCTTSHDSKEFDHNVVLPNGDVYICCMDYGLKHCIGNLYTTNFNNLDRTKLIEASNQYDSDCICRKCERVIID
jgi:radical SAM protein with 4Fe4S-binding SPASM domain